MRAISQAGLHSMNRRLVDAAETGLTEIGNQGKVSEILAGKRKLNARQIKSLAGRFKVSPAAFL